MKLMAIIITGLVKGYRYILSPIMVPACRYQPTCSQYALDALETHGALKGSYLAIRRLLRCHPWGGSGYDPVAPLEQGREKESCNH